MQELRIERARLSVDRPPAAPAGICHQHVHPAPLRGDAPDHRLDRLMVADIELDAQGGAARSFDLGDRALGCHLLGLGLKLFVRFQIEIDDRDFSPQPREAPRICPPEPTRRAGNDRDLAIELFHHAHLPLKTGRRFSTKALLASK